MSPIAAGGSSRTVAHLFNMMDGWRHLPGYRLEGRLAPFFELFLLDVLCERLGVELHPVVIPEFPLRKGTLFSCKDLKKPNQSYKVDYVAFSKCCKTAFLVELKTDMNSIDKDQEEYLRLARDKRKFGMFVEGVVKIFDATKHKPKYAHLLHRLGKLELVRIPNRNGLYEKTISFPLPDWVEAFDRVEPAVEGKLKCTRVIYIQPRERKPKQDFEYIYFEDVAAIVQRFGDLGCIFANYLRQWTENPGRQAPRTAADWP